MLKDILLYLDDSPACAARMQLALQLARTHEAGVTGIFITAHEFYQPRQRYEEAKLGEVADLLLRLAADAGVAARCRAIESSVVGVGLREQLLIRHARCTDLVMIGQERNETGAAPEVAEPLVLGAGRPVVIVPDVGKFPTIGTRVLVAWKNGREAARAVNDALPILKRARNVTLLAVSSDGSGADHWDGVVEHLARHGIRADTELMPASSVPLADILLNRAYEGSFDLLVMGAFGTTLHGKMHLGPAAARILREMTLPVLMAH